MVTRWEFFDGTNTWVVPVNPNEGGSPTMQKNITTHTNLGPNRHSILQEGESGPVQISFSGVILTQAHLETFETWFDKKLMLDLTDDLGREFQGVLSAFEPTREYRPNRPWFHRYSATFLVAGYRNASGQTRLARRIAL